MAATAKERIRASTYDVTGTEAEIKAYITNNTSSTNILNYSVTWKTNAAGTKYAVLSTTTKIS